MTAQPFVTERLAMRAQRGADADALHEAYSDAAVMRYWSSAPHATPDESVAYLTPQPGNDAFRGWTITVKGDDRAIGTLAATMRRAGVVEIGYLLMPTAWGHGYAREAVGGLIGLLFAEGNRRVFADTDPDNGASIGLLESLGFQREGLLRGEWETHIGVRDSVIWGLLRDDWDRRSR